MSLTDYISPVVLAEAGYIHESQSEAMLEHISREFLAEQGFHNLSHIVDIPISIKKAADMTGVKSETIKNYIALGFLKTDEDNRLRLKQVLTFNYDAAKRIYLDSKTKA